MNGATALAGLYLVNAEGLTEGDLAAVVGDGSQLTLTDRACSENWIRVTGCRVVSENVCRVEGERHDGKLFTQILDRDTPVIAREPEGTGS